jgi:Rod binding domain-containing protein
MDIDTAMLSYDMIKPEIAAAAPAATSAGGPAQKDDLREACEQAEGLFASILLKEGLRPLFEETQQSGSHAGGLIELAVEHMARDMGKEGALGIADTFYEQLSGNQIFSRTPLQRGER